MVETRGDIPLYTIGRIVELTGLTARQVRYYEKKGILAPARTQGNQRLFTHDQLEALLMIKRLLDEGYSLATVQELLPRAGSRRRGRDEYISMDALQQPTEPTSLYPLNNRDRLLEILDRLERRDQIRRRH